MASAGASVSKRRRSDISSCSPMSVTARRLLVAKSMRESEIQSVRETVAGRYS